MRYVPAVRAALSIAAVLILPHVAAAQASETWPAEYPSTVPLGYPQELPRIEPLPPGGSAPFAEIPPSEPVASSGPVEELPADVIAPIAWYSLDHWFGPVPWETSVELGLNGTQGTNDALSVRAGANVDRKTDWNLVDMDLIYNKASANNIETQNNAQFDARHDWLLAESPWTVFAATSVLYDEYQAFDLRFATNGGLGYRIIDVESTTLIGRFGAGTSREFGGPDERWVPEGLFGLELDHAINENQKIYGEIDYFPDWTDFSSYRVVTDVGWEVVLDDAANLSLKLSANDRYDSTPNGAEPNLLNYSVLLLWKL